MSNPELCHPALTKTKGLWAARAGGGRQPVYGCRCSKECETLWIKTSYGFGTITTMDLIRDEGDSQR